MIHVRINSQYYKLHIKLVLEMMHCYMPVLIYHGSKNGVSISTLVSIPYRNENKVNMVNSPYFIPSPSLFCCYVPLR